MHMITGEDLKNKNKNKKTGIWQLFREKTQTTIVAPSSKQFQWLKFISV